jgi:hypothetical protein
MFDSLERRYQLQRHESLLVPLDMLQQELVLADVGVGKIEFHLFSIKVFKMQFGTGWIIFHFLKITFFSFVSLMEAMSK